MKCAVVRNGKVINVIMAAPTDPAPGQSEIVLIPDDMTIDTRWEWNGARFIPSQALIDDMLAQDVNWNAEDQRFELSPALRARVAAAREA